MAVNRQTTVPKGDKGIQSLDGWLCLVTVREELAAFNMVKLKSLTHTVVFLDWNSYLTSAQYPASLKCLRIAVSTIIIMLSRISLLGRTAEAAL